MRELPILMNGPMVRAVLEGRKTVTRRVVKPQPNLETSRWYPDSSGSGKWMASGPSPATGGTRQTMPWFLCPYGQPGDRLWVREAWMDLLGTGVEHYDPVTRRPARYAYGADTLPGSDGDRCRKEYGLKWRPSIHMPRAASRLTLEITGVRVERLQDITHLQAIAEGVEQIEVGSGYPCFYSAAPMAWQEVIEGSAEAYPDAARAFRDLWQGINGADSWHANPWVWVIEFLRIEQERKAA